MAQLHPQVARAAVETPFQAELLSSDAGWVLPAAREAAPGPTGPAGRTPNDFVAVTTGLLFSVASRRSDAAGTARVSLVAVTSRTPAARKRGGTSTACDSPQMFTLASHVFHHGGGSVGAEHGSGEESAFIKLAAPLIFASTTTDVRELRVVVTHEPALRHGSTAAKPIYAVTLFGTQRTYLTMEQVKLLQSAPAPPADAAPAGTAPAVPPKRRREA